MQNIFYAAMLSWNNTVCVVTSFLLLVLRNNVGIDCAGGLQETAEVEIEGSHGGVTIQSWAPKQKQRNKKKKKIPNLVTNSSDPPPPPPPPPTCTTPSHPHALPFLSVPS